MERFSISFLCQQVYNICRLCGVDNPEKIPIIGAEDVIFVAESDEPTLARKIEQCVGIKVDLNDKMPQNICSLCVDKVNDFHEYRLMCEATNIQLRQFLNLPMVEPAKTVPKVEPESPVVVTLDDEDVDVKPNDKRGPKTRNRKKQSEADEPGKSEEADSKPFQDAPSEKRAKYDYPCQYCNESYSQSSELERHRVVKHTPLVHKFGCGSCMEYFDTATEYKDHNLWHKLTRTSFGCFRCGKKFVKISTLNKHVSLNACIRTPRVAHEVTLVPDMQCTLCQKVFKTRNLYEWHGCFMRAKANCPKCGKHFLKKNLLIRHFMLYCTGTIPLLDPIVVPKDEPGSGAVNGLPGSLPRVGTEVKRRGRPSRQAIEKMKEEMIDLPFPSLLDLPDVKSESNSIADGQMSSEGTLSGNETCENQKRSSLIKETDKITTLLRSGESVDRNTDINTINSMLSSVNEAIATISKVRKKKKKRDRLSSSGAGKAGETSDQSNPPMVVLSMANVKQEVYEDSNMLAPLAINSDGVENGLNESVPANVGHLGAEGAESDNDGVDDYDNGGDSYAHHNDDGDSDSDVEIISVEYNPPISSGTPLATNWNDSMRPINAHETEIVTEPTQPFGIQVKQEPMPTDDGDESDFEGYEDAAMFVAVKQELMEETIETAETAPVEQCSAMEKQSRPPISPYQALRIKIKKEKGLLNASVVGENGEEPVSTDSVPTHEENSEELANKRQTRADARTKTTTKTPAKRNISNPPPAKRYLRTTSPVLSVAIKQEPMEADEQVQESVTDPEQHSPPEATFFNTTTVQIKQEPQDKDNRTCSSTAPTSGEDESMDPSGEVAFDGTRIKRERPDDDPISQKRQAYNSDSLKNALNPLSLSGVRIAAGKKSSNSQPNVSAHKSGVMINPFALLKKKESVPTVTEKESGSKDSTDSLAGRSERFGLPVITQVKSIDPEEHLSLSVVDTVASEPTEGVEQHQKDISEEMDNLRHTESSLSSETPRAEVVAEIANNALPQKNVSEQKIESITSVPEVIVPPEQNVSELRIASVTTIPESNVAPQENVSELKITSVTTVPEDIVAPEQNVSQLRIASVTTIPESTVPPQEKVSELKIASVTTISDDKVEEGQTQEPFNEQQTSADNADGNAIPTDVSEPDDLKDLTPQQVPKGAEICSGTIVIENIATLDAGLDNEKRTLDDDEEQKKLHNEEEKHVVTVASESSDDVPGDKAATSTDDKQQKPQNHETEVEDAAATSSNIDKNADTDAVKNVTTLQDEMEVNINTASCTEQQQKQPSDASSVEEAHTETQQGFCAVANNDEILAVTQ